MVARISGSSANRVTPEELAALDDEIASLVKAGLPLAMGLREVAQDQPEPLSSIALSLAEHLARGKTLSQALDAGPFRFPAAYCRRIAEAEGRVSADAASTLADAFRRAKIRGRSSADGDA